MKKTFLLILIMNFISCSYINQEKIEIEIHNKSNSIVTDILFDTPNDTLTVNKLEKNQTISKTLEYSIDEGISSWGISFKRNNGNVEELGCTDILSERKKRILKITILDDKIDTEFNGECY